MREEVKVVELATSMVVSVVTQLTLFVKFIQKKREKNCEHIISVRKVILTNVFFSLLHFPLDLGYFYSLLHKTMDEILAVVRNDYSTNQGQNIGSGIS